MDYKLDMTLVQLPNGDIQPVRSGAVVNAAGPFAAEVGTGSFTAGY